MSNRAGHLVALDGQGRAQRLIVARNHAEDDDNDKVDVKSRRDSFCGKLSVCNNLYQYGIPFTDTTYHTCKIASTTFRNDIQKFAAVCRVIGGLKHARIGAIGARPAAFQTMRSSEKLLQLSGITVVPVDMSEIIGEAQRIDNNAGILKSKVTEITIFQISLKHLQLYGLRYTQVH